MGNYPSIQLNSTVNEKKNWLHKGVFTAEDYLKLSASREAQSRMLSFMGISGFEALFTKGEVKIHSPIGKDDHPSAGLILGKDDGRVLFFDFRGSVGDKHLTLSRLFMRLAGADWRTQQRPTCAVWGARLLIQAGVVCPVEVYMPPCPQLRKSHHGQKSLQKCYAGIHLLYRVRWTYQDHTDKPIPLGKDFLAPWCGITPDQARDGVRDLLKAGVIYTAEKKGPLRYFLPGQYFSQQR